MTSELLGIADGVRAVTGAARAIAQTEERLGWLPGLLDWRWQRQSSFSSVTGTAQLSLIWMRLHALGGEPIFLTSALRGIEAVKASQARVASADVSGAIPGSDPLWGAYVPLAYPNWASKFFIDALLAKRRALAAQQSG